MANFLTTMYNTNIESVEPPLLEEYKKVPLKTDATEPRSPKLDQFHASVLSKKAEDAEHRRLAEANKVPERVPTAPLLNAPANGATFDNYGRSYEKYTSKFTVKAAGADKAKKTETDNPGALRGPIWVTDPMSDAGTEVVLSNYSDEGEDIPEFVQREIKVDAHEELKNKPMTAPTLAMSTQELTFKDPKTTLMTQAPLIDDMGAKVVNASLGDEPEVTDIGIDIMPIVGLNTDVKVSDIGADIKPTNGLNMDPAVTGIGDDVKSIVGLNVEPEVTDIGSNIKPTNGLNMDPSVTDIGADIKPTNGLNMDPAVTGIGDDVKLNPYEELYTRTEFYQNFVSLSNMNLGDMWDVEAPTYEFLDRYAKFEPLQYRYSNNGQIQSEYVYSNAAATSRTQFPTRGALIPEDDYTGSKAYYTAQKRDEYTYVKDISDTDGVLSYVPKGVKTDDNLQADFTPRYNDGNVGDDGYFTWTDDHGTLKPKDTTKFLTKKVGSTDDHLDTDFKTEYNQNTADQVDGHYIWDGKHGTLKPGDTSKYLTKEDGDAGNVLDTNFDEERGTEDNFQPHRDTGYRHQEGLDGYFDPDLQNHFVTKEIGDTDDNLDTNFKVRYNGSSNTAKDGHYDWKPHADDGGRTGAFIPGETDVAPVEVVKNSDTELKTDFTDKYNAKGTYEWEEHRDTGVYTHTGYNGKPIPGDKTKFLTEEVGDADSQLNTNFKATYNKESTADDGHYVWSEDHGNLQPGDPSRFLSKEDGDTGTNLNTNFKGQYWVQEKFEAHQTSGPHTTAGRDGKPLPSDNNASNEVHEIGKPQNIVSDEELNTGFTDRYNEGADSGAYFKWKEHNTTGPHRVTGRDGRALQGNSLDVRKTVYGEGVQEILSIPEGKVDDSHQQEWYKLRSHIDTEAAYEDWVKDNADASEEEKLAKYEELFQRDPSSFVDYDFINPLQQPKPEEGNQSSPIRESKDNPYVEYDTDFVPRYNAQGDYKWAAHRDEGAYTHAGYRGQEIFNEDESKRETSYGEVSKPVRLKTGTDARGYETIENSMHTWYHEPTAAASQQVYEDWLKDNSDASAEEKEQKVKELFAQDPSTFTKYDFHNKKQQPNGQAMQTYQVTIKEKGKEDRAEDISYTLTAEPDNIKSDEELDTGFEKLYGKPTGNRNFKPHRTGSEVTRTRDGFNGYIMLNPNPNFPKQQLTSVITSSALQVYLTSTELEKAMNGDKFQVDYNLHHLIEWGERINTGFASKYNNGKHYGTRKYNPNTQEHNPRSAYMEIVECRPGIWGPRLTIKKELSKVISENNLNTNNIVFYNLQSYIDKVTAQGTRAAQGENVEERYKKLEEEFKKDPSMFSQFNTERNNGTPLIQPAKKGKSVRQTTYSYKPSQVVRQQMINGIKASTGRDYGNVNEFDEDFNAPLTNFDKWHNGLVSPGDMADATGLREFYRSNISSIATNFMELMGTTLGNSIDTTANLINTIFPFKRLWDPLASVGMWQAYRAIPINWTRVPIFVLASKSNPEMGVPVMNFIGIYSDKAKVPLYGPLGRPNDKGPSDWDYWTNIATLNRAVSGSKTQMHIIADNHAGNLDDICSDYIVYAGKNKFRGREGIVDLRRGKYIENKVPTKDNFPVNFGTEYYWDILFDYPAGNEKYLPAMPYEGWIPVQSFNIIGSQMGSTSVETIAGSVSIPDSYQLPSSIQITLPETSYYDVDHWMRAYFAAIFTPFQGKDKEAPTKMPSMHILPYKQQTMYITIYWLTEQWIPVRKKTFICIPEFKFQYNGTSEKALETKEINFNIVGTRGFSTIDFVYANGTAANGIRMLE